MNIRDLIKNKDSEIIDRLERLASLDIRSDNQPVTVSTAQRSAVERLDNKQPKYVIEFSNTEGAFQDALKLYSHLKQNGLTKSNDDGDLVALLYKDGPQPKQYELAENLTVTAREGKLKIEFAPLEASEHETVQKLDAAIAQARIDQLKSRQTTAGKSEHITR
jgi:hypothetical protein